MENLAGRTDADISFEKIHIKPFNTLVLKNAAIVDRAPAYENAADTLFKSEYVIVRFTLKGLRRQEGLHVWRAFIRNAEMNLVIEEDMTNLQRIFGISRDRQKKPQDKNVFDVRRVDIDGMRFRLQNFRMENDKETPADAMDWNRLDVKNIRIEARNLRLSRGKMSGRVDRLSFEEKSGYICSSLSGKAEVGGGRAVISDLVLTDLWSDVSISSFIMSYASPKDFKHFTEKVRLDAEIEESTLDMATLGFFAPPLKGKTFRAKISGRAGGTVESLNLDGLKIDGSGLSGTFTGRLAGLPDTRALILDMKMEKLMFSPSGLGTFIGSWTGGAGPQLDKYAGDETFTVDATARGPLDRLALDLSATSGIGGLSASLNAENLMSARRSVTIDGIVSSHDLDLGKVTGSGLLGPCTMTAGLSADLGNRGGSPSVRLDSLLVDRLSVKGYDYSGIAAAGTIAKEAFDGKIICSDPNLSFMLQGQFNLSRKTSNALYRFYLNVGYADLNAMNLDKRGISRMRFQTDVNFSWLKRKGDLLGDIDVSGLVLENGMGKHEIGDICVKSYSGDDLTRMTFSSDFAEGRYTGSGSLREFISTFSAVTLRRELPSMFKDTVDIRQGGRYKLSFRCFDTMDLLAFVMPGLYVADSTDISVAIDTAGFMNAKIKSQRIAFREQYVKDLECTFDNMNGSLGGELRSESISAATLLLRNNRIELFADDDHIGIGFSYDNRSTLTNRGEFFATGDLSRDGDGMMGIKVSLLPSSVHLNSREWGIMPSTFSIRGGEIEVENVEFRSGDQSIRVYGATSSEKDTSLILDMERFDISIVNPLLKKDMGFSGAVTGRAEMISPYSDMKLSLDFLCDSTAMAGTPLGTLTLGSRLDKSTGTMDFRLENSIGGTKSVSLEGKYGLKARRLSAEAALDGFDIGCAKPFLESIFSDIGGSVSGRMTLDGPLDRLSIRSDGARFTDARLKIAFTNVEYLVNGGFHMDETGIYFDDVSMTDGAGGRGRIQGKISHDYFSDIRFATRINVREMQCVDIPESPGSTFYGDVSATGSVEISGPVRSILMTVNAVTTGDGQFHIPLSSSATSGSGNLLTFKQPVTIRQTDPYEEMMARFKEQESSPGDFSMKIRVAATPEVEALIEIDKATGNVLSGRGQGVIDLEIQPKKDIFNITGDYTISSGNYRFVALGLASRDFSIQEGSSVRFNGDIMESTLDIDAVYRTKASLSTLIADTTSVSNRRTVECGISITDQIRNPRLGFSINIPDLDPMVQSRVESALSTEDKVQKQFLSLIISNSFLPDEQSGIVNNSTLLYSNVTDIMANQLNNIFQKLDIPLDLGLSYQPNDKGNDIFDVAVSTQLFNNRVIVNGNIGNRQYSSGSGESDVVGDLDIEIKLTRNGALRLNLFSHSADEYTNYLDNSQRNGVGIAYQKEFDRLDTFFRNMFTGKKKREEAQRREMEMMRGRERKVIRITGNEDGRRRENKHVSKDGR